MPHGGVSSYIQIPTVGLLEECKRPTQTALSRVTDDQRSNLTDSIIQLSEKDRYDLKIKLSKMRPLVETAQFSHYLKILQIKPTTEIQEAKLVERPRYVTCSVRKREVIAVQALPTPFYN